MSHLPRNGQYELFTYQGKTHCFDDLTLPAIDAKPEMFEWLRSLPEKECRPMDETNVAFYLTPKMYLLWKLKWS